MAETASRIKYGTIETPAGHRRILDEFEMRRLFALARYGLNQKKELNLPMTSVEAMLESILNSEEFKF